MVLRIPLLNLNETKGVIILTEKRKDSALVTGEVLEFILMHVCGILEFWVLKCRGKIWTFVRFTIMTVTYMCTDLCSGQIQYCDWESSMTRKASSWCSLTKPCSDLAVPHLVTSTARVVITSVFSVTSLDFLTHKSTQTEDTQSA